MHHENENDTFENVFPKYRITPEEEIVINKAAEAYQIHKFKNRILRDKDEKWSSEDYLAAYPDYFERHSKNKLRAKGKTPSDIIDDYFIEKGESTNNKRWYNLARSVIAIGEHMAKYEIIP
tara:strand:+ start:3610 stop:3972 length:363 start_codon:yes stop_codon:yes gene_type:complete